MKEKPHNGYVNYASNSWTHYNENNRIMGHGNKINNTVVGKRDIEMQLNPFRTLVV